MPDFEVQQGGKRLDQLLRDVYPAFSRAYFQKIIAEGLVLVNGKPAVASDKPKTGAHISFDAPPPEELSAKPQDIPLEIIYEDADILVINKPKGMVVHPAPGSPSKTLVNALLAKVEDLSGIGGVLRPGIVHRLDKDTTGLLVVAKNDAAHQNLAEQIQNKTALRIYWALVFGDVKEEGVIDAPIARSKRDRKLMAVDPVGKKAVTHYKPLEWFSKYTLVEAKLETGRTHQIRVHFKKIGHPVVGDPVYTKLKAPFETQGQMLHAAKLILNHPKTGKSMEFSAPLPPYFVQILEKLRKMAT